MSNIRARKKRAKYLIVTRNTLIVSYAALMPLNINYQIINTTKSRKNHLKLRIFRLKCDKDCSPFFTIAVWETVSNTSQDLL